jgi:mannitol/fructose-specific phosphotransferase system IIA component (Ntr-type)
MEKSSFITIEDVSACLGVSVGEASKMLSSSSLHPKKISGSVSYERNELMGWLQRTMGTLTLEKLRDADFSGRSKTGLDPSTPFVRSLLEAGGVYPDVPARTASSVLRRIAAIACETGRVYDCGLLVDLLTERERVSSTALPAGVAFPHPVDSRRIYLEDNLLILARTCCPIPFGEPSGRLTSLYFLLLFENPASHLHVLARLNRIIRMKGLVERLVTAETGLEMLDTIIEAEEGLLST